ncbi:histidine phosphatase family protein [Chloroflexota bacterium]
MTEIILARHGETEWNVKEVFRGRIDVDLTETGIKQAELLADYLSKTEIQAVYSSPLKRSLKMAELIAGHHKLAVTSAPGLIDFDFGEWHGLSHDEVKDKYNELYHKWLDSPHQLKMPGGENLDEVTERAMGVVREAISRHSGTVVLVAHRVVNKVLICALLGLDNSHFWNIRQDVGAITTFDYDNGRFVLAEHNNISYLSSLQQKQLGDF